MLDIIFISSQQRSSNQSNHSKAQCHAIRHVIICLLNQKSGPGRLQNTFGLGLPHHFSKPSATTVEPHNYMYTYTTM